MDLLHGFGRGRGLAGLTLVVALGCGDDAEEAADGGSTSTTGVTSIVPTTTDGDAGTDTDAGTDSATTGEPLPDPLPPLDAAPLTTDETIVPTAPVAMPEAADPRDPAARAQLLADGFGDFNLGPGEPIADVTLDGMPPPPSGAAATRLTRFVHLADVQLADDESPARAVAFDSPFISGGFRPQEQYGCRVLNAAARTINALHTADPIEMVILGGDNVDSAQQNEVQWFRDILDGAPVVRCDSGALDDPEPGPDNDPKDAFAPVGLDVPWRWLTGNHDLLVQGNFIIEGREALAVGAEVFDGGTRDWSQPGGPMVVNGAVVPDPARALLDGVGLLELAADGGDGHGVDAVASSGRSSYTFDTASGDIRFVFVDTASPTGADRGVVRQPHVDTFIRPALDQAETDGVQVIVATHHASTSLGDGGGLGGMVQPDAWSTAEWQSLLGEYGNIVAHLAGHSHEHRIVRIEPLGGNAYYEITSAAIADWPNQMRLIEIRDEDNSLWSLTLVSVDYATDGDPIAAEARPLGILDYTSAWLPDGRGMLEDRNVRLWIDAP